MSHKLGRRARRRLNPGPAKPTGLLIEAGVETGKDLAFVLLLGLVTTIPALIAFFFDVFDNGAHFLLVFAMLWAAGVTSCLTISHPNKRAGGVIRFDNATVFYSNSPLPALNRFSLEVSAGETIALVGA